jgi:hypothetical protein
MNNSTIEKDMQHEDYWCPLLTSGVTDVKTLFCPELYRRYTLFDCTDSHSLVD